VRAVRIIAKPAGLITEKSINRFFSSVDDAIFLAGSAKTTPLATNIKITTRAFNLICMNTNPYLKILKANS
jgi:hypothetical protein